MDSFLLQYIALWHPLGYVVIWFGLMIEGDALLFAALFLVHHKVFALGPMLGTVISGVLIGDALWYTFGKWGAVKFPRIARMFMSATARFEPLLIQKPFRALFLSKFTYGLHHPLLMRAGMQRLSFKKFFWNDLRATALWIGVVGGLGYVAGASVSGLGRSVKFIEIILALAVVLFLLIEVGITRRVRKIFSDRPQ